MLYLKKPDTWEFKELAKYGEVLTNEQIMQRWPAMRIPKYLCGVFAKEAGVVKVKEAISLTQELAVHLGADLRYNKNVAHIDHEKGEVTLENGEKF